MYITKIIIKNFRSVETIDIECDKLSVLCGPNSVGKSNVFRALEFAFSSEHSEQNVIDNISYNKKDSNVQIHVDLHFERCPKKVRDLANSNAGDPVKYVFRATKKGKITRKLNSESLDDDGFSLFNNEFSIVYIPTIRDLDGDGIIPFQQLFRKSVYAGPSGKQIREHLSGIKSELAKKASTILTDQKDVVQNILNAKAFDINTDSVVIDDSYDSIKLAIKTYNNRRISLSDVGTGHQSVAIISLYRQLGEATPGHTLYLFEEPDTHLHPPTVRAVGEELIKASDKSQVFITTHSPILISHIGLHKVFYLTHTEQSGTSAKKTEFLASDQPTISHLLMQFGLRLTEALFTKTVILVEGPSDVAVIGRLFEIRAKRNIDQLDILMVHAGGKGTMPNLASALTKLGINWIAILDHDAAYNTDSVPITTESGYLDYLSDEGEDYTSMIDSIISTVDDSEKRGNNVVKQLKLLRNEFENGRPGYEVYEGSALKALIQKARDVSATGQDNIKRAIRRNRKTIYRRLLRDQGIYLVTPDIEKIMTSKDKNLPVIEQVLRNKRVIKTGTASPCDRAFLAKKLHSIGYKSDILVEVVDKLEEIAGFSRTELNIYVRELVDTVMN